MSTLQKLTLYKGVIVNGAPVFPPGGERIEALYNPGEYSVSASNSFGESQVVGLTQPVVQFGAGQARSLSLELLSDTHAYGEEGDAHAALVAKLETLLELVPGLMAPPPCRVVWGAGLSFVGVLESLEARYVYFAADGTPLRARASLRFKELIRPPSPVPGASVVRKIAALEEGRSLPELAQKAVGDPRKWRDLANAHGIDNPRRRTGR